MRLLDGTGDAEHVQRAAPLVVPADAEIVVVGNADAFDYEETEIRYHNPVARGGGRAPSRTPWAPAVWSTILARPMRSMSPSCSGTDL